MLNSAQVGTGLQHVSGAGVPEHVRVNALLYTGASPGSLAQIADGSRIQETVGAPIGRKQQRCRLIPAAIGPKPLEQDRRQSDVPRNTPFALTDMDDHLLAVDIAHVQSGSIRRCECPWRRARR